MMLVNIGARRGAVVPGGDGEGEHNGNYTVGTTHLGVTDSTLCNTSFSNKMKDCIEGSALRNYALQAKLRVDPVSRSCFP